MTQDDRSDKFQTLRQEAKVRMQQAREEGRPMNISNRLTTDHDSKEERDITPEDAQRILNLPSPKQDLLDKLMALHNLPQPTAEEILERNRMYDEMAAIGLDPRDPMFTYNLASRANRISPPMMIVSTPNSPHDETMAKRLMEGLEKAPWEFMPYGHPELPQVHWGNPQIVSDDSELAKLTNKLRLDDMIDDTKAFNEHIVKNAATHP